MKDNIHLIELRMAVTFKNFGNDPFEEQAKDSKIVTEIAVAVDKMISCIDDSVIKL